jgi:hypothetical protein
MYTRAWTNAVLGTNPANTIDTLLANIREDVNERLTDLLSIASFTADPLVATALKLNRTANAKILGGTANTSIRNAADTQDNVLIDNAGNMTVKGSITLGATSALTGLVNVSYGGGSIGLNIADSTLAYWIVSVGAVDSGGVGYRLLRVGNAFTP